MEKEIGIGKMFITGFGYLLFLSGSTHDIPRFLKKEAGYVV